MRGGVVYTMEEPTHAPEALRRLPLAVVEHAAELSCQGENFSLEAIA